MELHRHYYQIAILVRFKQFLHLLLAVLLVASNFTFFQHILKVYHVFAFLREGTKIITSQNNHQLIFDLFKKCIDLIGKGIQHVIQNNLRLEHVLLCCLNEIFSHFENPQVRIIDASIPSNIHGTMIKLMMKLHQRHIPCNKLVFSVLFLEPAFALHDMLSHNNKRLGCRAYTLYNLV